MLCPTWLVIHPSTTIIILWLYGDVYSHTVKLCHLILAYYSKSNNHTVLHIQLMLGAHELCSWLNTQNNGSQFVLQLVASKYFIHQSRDLWMIKAIQTGCSRTIIMIMQMYNERHKSIIHKSQTCERSEPHELIVLEKHIIIRCRMKGTSEWKHKFSIEFNCMEVFTIKKKGLLQP